MNIAYEVFRKYRVLPDKLEKYGFTKNNGKYSYSKLFFNNDFRLDMTIDENGNIESKVIDVNFDDIYDALDIEYITSGYVITVRDEYKKELEKIRDNCFKEMFFIFDQTNRIADIIKKKYNEKPDYPFLRAKEYAVYRYPDTEKWYILVGNIKRGKVEKTDSEELVEVINVKVEDDKYDEYIKMQGIFPAYHMRTHKWVSIILDDTLSDKEVMKFIDVSRNFAMINKVKKKSK